MLSEDKRILYIGKAKNLKSRVSSYFRSTGLAPKTQALMRDVCSIEITVTHSDTEALLLECTLIKAHLPHYNILLRDDKSMPYIVLTEHDYPRLGYHRGKKKDHARYFGPFHSGRAVQESLDLLQKVFRLRTCEDNEFKNRSRPCLLHQMNRCNAPCVRGIDVLDYARDVEHVVQFLSGKSEDVISALKKSMDEQSDALQYEQAAMLRDQMMQLRHVQEKQYVFSDKGEADVLAVDYQAPLAVVYVLKVRQGQLVSGHAYFPVAPQDSTAEDVLEAFISQFYLDGEREDIPKQIILNRVLDNGDSLASALSEVSGCKVELLDRVKTDKAQWLEMARLNAEQALTAKLATRANIQERFFALKQDLNLEQIPKRIDCFDISHTMGEATIGACVAFDETGPLSKIFRRYNITDVTAGDDYAALGQAFKKHYKHTQELPDIILVDGGKGQLMQLSTVFKELGLHSILLAIAKGPGRRHGEEKIYRIHEGEQRVVPVSALSLHLLRQIDDKAHDWAIAGHRKKRDQTRLRSRLDMIPGIGPQRRRELLRFFGSFDVIKGASMEEIRKVPGVSQALAQRIYQALHESEG